LKWIKNKHKRFREKMPHQNNAAFFYAEIKTGLKSHNHSLPSPTNQKIATSSE